MSAAKSVPKHLGLILDGNRRWAKKQGLPQLEGHKKGYENLKTIGQAALDAGVQYVSAYVFSTENWKRSKREVDYLMRLLQWVVTDEVEEFHKQDIRVRFAGSRDKLNTKIIQSIEAAELKTKQNNRGQLIMCLNYGGHQELVDATKAIVEQGTKPEDIHEADIIKNLYVPDVPPIDLIIRTSGEQRLSNFMLWRAAYSEFMYADKHWPEFNKADLNKCLSRYAQRQRRFGE